uniref:Uncharacterized protein n=1 Tax=Haptolina brevifila TaxID=156173 RepID=A0A7S2NGR5_9EUKA|mmetsp:Transcript_78112/g.155232  ORF Transcript_78112/g.155232 Transcript_78112/m.155232 type:complete len:222 (+) Transcript_78112:176-841(+)|eukprot:CAMPEP_0174719924 /NCGR_PEP_ID=MMETSP1094-20130205/32363_1 /TAXON_ID=156173 /ORGANISM="Chrysochromulina brevifilum, Strain UTEX LB 985" /LENGTH=221 /DNA_ID=CAMNT_0015920329 /DNA_START=160 /DNA_END=825 /DNA_ORIENTATION=+
MPQKKKSPAVKRKPAQNVSEATLGNAPVAAVAELTERDDQEAGEDVQRFDAIIDAQTEADEIKAAIEIFGSRKLAIISARFGGTYDEASLAISAVLEAKEDWELYNPNRENASDSRDGETAEEKRRRLEGRRLRTFVTMLRHSARYGGCLLRLISNEEGPSDMQEAEADIAKHYGVRVIERRFSSTSWDAALFMVDTESWWHDITTAMLAMEEIHRISSRG